MLVPPQAEGEEPQVEVVAGVGAECVQVAAVEGDGVILRGDLGDGGDAEAVGEVEGEGAKDPPVEECGGEVEAEPEFVG